MGSVLHEQTKYIRVYRQCNKYIYHGYRDGAKFKITAGSLVELEKLCKKEKVALKLRDVEAPEVPKPALKRAIDVDLAGSTEAAAAAASHSSLAKACKTAAAAADAKAAEAAADAAEAGASAQQCQDLASLTFAAISSGVDLFLLSHCFLSGSDTRLSVSCTRNRASALG